MPVQRLRMLAVLVAAVAPLVASADTGRAADPQALLARFKCYLCHADRETKTGPAYVDVAEHFRKMPSSVAFIASEIRQGLKHGGPWHMPPHPEVSDAEARQMARYIMSLKR